jgi:hypothetical protein
MHHNFINLNHTGARRVCGPLIRIVVSAGVQSTEDNIFFRTGKKQNSPEVTVAGLFEIFSRTL